MSGTRSLDAEVQGDNEGAPPPVTYINSGLPLGDPPPVYPEQRAARRNKANAIPTRVIVIDDGNEAINDKLVLGEPGTFSAEQASAALRAPRIGRLEGTAVTSLFLCTGGNAFGLHTHDVREMTGNEDESRAKLNVNEQDAENRLDELYELGIDPLADAVQFGAQNGKEVFWTIRMSDNHDGNHTSADRLALFLRNPLKSALAVGPCDRPDGGDCYANTLRPYPDERPTRTGSWAGYNYERAAVRDLALDLIEDVACRYDVDGINLDFFRHVAFFPETFFGNEATGTQRGLMTAFLRDVRSKVDRCATERDDQSPILIAATVPDDQAYAMDLGLDVESWIENDYIDLLLAGGYFQLHPWESADSILSLAQGTDVKAIPTLEEARNDDTAAESLREDVMGMRGRLLTAWRANPDGVALVNFHPSPSSRTYTLLDEAVSAEALREGDADYFVTTNGRRDSPGGQMPFPPLPESEMGWLQPEAPLEIVGAVYPLFAGKSVTIRTGANLTAGPYGNKVRVRVRVKNPQAAEEEREIVSASSLIVWLDGVPLNSLPAPSRIYENDDPDDEWIASWFDFHIPSFLLTGHPGVHTVMLGVSGDTVLWEDAQIQVRHQVVPTQISLSLL